jgi:single-strand DNA-binding protein
MTDGSRADGNRTDGEATNIVVVRGRLSRPAELRLLASGARQVELQLAVPGPDGRAESVPVVWPSAPASAAALDVDEQVTVVGRVRRRFFRSGNATQSRTEVVADQVVPARQAKRARAALDGAALRVADAARG